MFFFEHELPQIIQKIIYWTRIERITQMFFFEHGLLVFFEHELPQIIQKLFIEHGLSG